MVPYSIEFSEAVQESGNVQSILLLYRSIEDPAFSARPVENLWSIGGVDLVFGQSFQCSYLRLNVWWQLSHVFLHKPLVRA